MTSLPMEACWRSQDVSAVISNEALEGHEGIFLATHTPIKGFAIAGSHAGEIAESDEQSVLDVLALSDREHAFCVVQGEPGSGKSHLIRWLYVNWPNPADIKLLLQRADGSLEGALRQLRERLPSEFADLFDNLGRSHRATVQGRANIFLSNLANALEPGHFDPPLEDVRWCQTHWPADVLRSIGVRQHWKSPGRLLRLLEGQGSGEAAQRNSESASFNVFDVKELADVCGDIRHQVAHRETIKLVDMLRNEAQVITQHQNAGWSAAEIELELKSSIPSTIRFIDALNRRRNDAIQNVLGISAEGLKTLFRQIRSELAKSDKRLVLLLEDITSWEGIDDSLIDVLVTNARTRGDWSDGDDASTNSDMCPLISVVGVTPAYYQKLHGNYRGRITHELALGQTREATDLQDVATLRDRAARLSFVARYLAAVRVGPDALFEWRKECRVEPSLPPPNKCLGCVARDACHRTFGTDQAGYGFFPFTPDALERLFAALNERDNGLTWKTPRGILQAVLNPNLSRPDAIGERQFPTVYLETNALPLETRKLSSRLERTVMTVVAEEERPRMRRLLAYWGDRERADTVRLANGELAFANVPYGVFGAFGLPWIGEDNPGGATVRPVEVVPPVGPDNNEHDELDPTPVSRRAQSGQMAARPTAKQPTTGHAGVPPPPSKRKAPTKSELERFRDQLRIWGETGELGSPSEWNKFLYEMVCKVESRRVGLDQGTFSRLLTPGQVKIEGTAPAQRSYFTVSPTDWVRDGFEAYIALRLDSSMSDQDIDFHRRNLAFMMRRLENLVDAYADQRLSRLTDGRRWAPVAAISQILLARAWLRGTISPSDSLPSQLQAILSDEAEAESDPASRCTLWNEFLNKTKDHHTDFRTALYDMLKTPQGDAPGFGLADVSVVAGALRRLNRTLRFDDLPDPKADTLVPLFEKARELIRQFKGTLKHVMAVERDQIRNRAKTLFGYLRSQSIASHYCRLDKAIEAVSNELPNAVPDQVQKWKQGYLRLLPRLEEKADVRVEDMLFTISENGEGIPERDADLFVWLIKAPSKDIEDMLKLADLGEKVVANLLQHVRDCVHEGEKAVSMEAIQSIGREIKAAIPLASPGKSAEEFVHA